jgi:hypothetical protein
LLKFKAPALMCRHAGGAASLLGDSYDSLALQLLGEVEAGAPLVAAKVQPAKFKPFLSAVLRVSVMASHFLLCSMRLLPQHPSQPSFECMQRSQPPERARFKLLVH